MTSALNFSSAPVAVLAVQLLFVSALAIGFRHSIRVPADLRAKWMFHLIRPAAHDVYLRGVKRAAVVKLVVPALVVLLPFHLLALRRQSVIPHFTFGLLGVLVLGEILFLGYRRLPFASSYVPSAKFTTLGAVYALFFFIGCLHGGVAGVSGTEHQNQESRSLCRPPQLSSQSSAAWMCGSDASA